MSRIILPSTAAGWKKLHDNIKNQHDADGGASPLNVLLTEEAIDMNDDNKDLGTSVKHNDEFIKAQNEAEELREDRDDLFDPSFSVNKTSSSA